MPIDLESEEGLRAYVEAELDRTLRASHPELDITFKSHYPAGTPSSRLWWHLTDPAAKWLSFYTLEVRRDQREFLIWYGFSSAGATNPRHLMRHAVHVSFDAYDPKLREDQPAWWTGSAGGLGEVLEIVVAHREPSRSISYPMNCPTLT